MLGRQRGGGGGRGAAQPQQQPADPTTLLCCMVCHTGRNTRRECRVGTVTRVVVDGRTSGDGIHVWEVTLTDPTPSGETELHYTWTPTERGALGLREAIDTFVLLFGSDFKSSGGARESAYGTHPDYRASDDGLTPLDYVKGLDAFMQNTDGTGDCFWHSMARGLGYANVGTRNVYKCSDEDVQTLRNLAHGVLMDPEHKELFACYQSLEKSSVKTPKCWVGELAARALAIGLERDIVLLGMSYCVQAERNKRRAVVCYADKGWKGGPDGKQLGDVPANLATLQSWLSGDGVISVGGPNRTRDQQRPLICHYNGRDHFQAVIEEPQAGADESDSETDAPSPTPSPAPAPAPAGQTATAPEAAAATSGRRTNGKGPDKPWHCTVAGCSDACPGGRGFTKRGLTSHTTRFHKDATGDGQRARLAAGAVTAPTVQRGVICAPSGQAPAKRGAAKTERCTVPGCKAHINGNLFSPQGLAAHTTRMHTQKSGDQVPRDTPGRGAQARADAARAAAAKAGHAAAPAPLPSSRVPTEADWAWAAGQSYDWISQKGLCPVRRTLNHYQAQNFGAAADTVLGRAAEGDKGALWLFSSLPRLVLPRLPPGVMPSSDKYNNATLCRMFQEGRWKDLLEIAMWREEEAKKLVRPEPEGEGDGASAGCPSHKAAKTLMEVGEYSKAMNRLTATSGTLEPTEEVMEKLKALHPASGALTPEELAFFEAQRKAMLAGFASPEAQQTAANSAVAAATVAAALGEDAEEDDSDLAATLVHKPLQLSATAVKHAIRSSPKGSAGAGTGWLYEHIKAITVSYGNSTRMADFTALLQLVAQGRLPDETAAAWGTSTLTPLQKETDGVRPIAIGEVIARTAGRAVCHQKKADLEAVHQPIQYGVMSRNGAEQVKHTITAHMHKYKGHTLCSLDIANAFNTVKRNAFMHNILAGPPAIRELFPWIAQFYLNDADLLVYGKTGEVKRLKSRSGSRQGDPPGAFLFCIAIHPALKKVQADFEGDGVRLLAYMDDIYILGPPDKALEATRALRAALRELNLEVSTGDGKCWVHCPNEEDYAAMTAPEPQTRREESSDSDDDALPRLLDPEPDPGFRLQAKWTYKVLGVFSGEEAAAKTLDKVTDTIKPKALGTKLEALRQFGMGGHAALASQLLLSCAAPSLNYALRASEPPSIAAMAKEADAMLRNTFAALSSLDPDTELAPGSRACEQLRMRQGDGAGAGLASVVTLSKTAYLASWAACGPLIAKRWPDLADIIAALDDPTKAEAGSFAAHLAKQRTHAVDNLGLGDMLDEELSFTVASIADSSTSVAAAGATAASTGLKWQKRFAAAEAARAKAAVKEAMEDEAAGLKEEEALPLKAWHNSLAADGRAAFLHSMPTAWLKPLNNEEFEFAVRRLLRLPLRNLAHGHSRCACGATMDKYGDHADSCPLLILDRHTRHRKVNAEGIIAPARQAKLAPTIETPGLVEDSNGRPADTGVRSGHGFGAGVHACYDVVGVGTCAKSYVEAAARYTGGAWGPAVKRKLNQAVVLKGTEDLLVIPMAFESQGGMHPNWRVTYEQWADRWAGLAEDRPRWRQGLMVRYWMARTCLVIQREQFRAVTRMVGRATLVLHGQEPRAHRPMCTDAFDCVQNAMPPMEVV